MSIRTYEYAPHTNVVDERGATVSKEVYTLSKDERAEIISGLSRDQRKELLAVLFQILLSEP